MKLAPVPENEKERLISLQSYRILDTAPEIEFDDITELASSLCQTPIALVSLVDENRQWFKSKKGLDAFETARNISFCGHTICQDEIFEIPNAYEDPRFSDNPLVLGDPQVVFYAGVPLVNNAGYSLGALCVIDHKPRTLSEEQKQQLKALGRHVISQMELKRSNVLLKKALSQLEKQRQTYIENAKLASLGQMAGGIAHEINTPLSIIQLSTFSIMAAAKKEDYSKLGQQCEKIDRTVGRIAKIVSSLRSICRESQDDPKQWVTASAIIEDTLSICFERFKNHNVKLEQEIKGDINVFCRPGEISQVLLNLLSNAFDAVVEQEAPWVKIVVENQEQGVLIAVVDSGNPGTIPSNAMEAFVTTKAVGKGTGLGLSITKKLIEGHGGQFQLRRDSVNTRFELLLPNAESVEVKEAA